MSFHDEYSSFKPPSIVLGRLCIAEMGKGGGGSRPTLMAWKWSVICIKVVTRLSLFKEMKAHGVGAPVQPYEVLSSHRKTVKKKSPWVHKWSLEKKRKRKCRGKIKFTLSIHFWHDIFKQLEIKTRCGRVLLRECTPHSVSCLMFVLPLLPLTVYD